MGHEILTFAVLGSRRNCVCLTNGFQTKRAFPEFVYGDEISLVSLTVFRRKAFLASEIWLPRVSVPRPFRIRNPVCDFRRRNSVDETWNFAYEIGPGRTWRTERDRKSWKSRFPFFYERFMDETLFRNSGIQCAQFVCFTNGFARIRLASSFSEPELLRWFPVGLPTNAVIFFEFPTRGGHHFWYTYVDRPPPFRQKGGGTPAPQTTSRNGFCLKEFKGIALKFKEKWWALHFPKDSLRKSIRKWGPPLFWKRGPPFFPQGFLKESLRKWGAPLF